MYPRQDIVVRPLTSGCLLSQQKLEIPKIEHNNDHKTRPSKFVIPTGWMKL